MSELAEDRAGETTRSLVGSRARIASDSSGDPHPGGFEYANRRGVSNRREREALLLAALEPVAAMVPGCAIFLLFRIELWSICLS